MQETQRFFSRISKKKSWCTIWRECVREKRQQWWQRILRIIKLFLLCSILLPKFTFLLRCFFDWLFLFCEAKSNYFCANNLWANVHLPFIYIFMQSCNHGWILKPRLGIKFKVKRQKFVKFELELLKKLWTFLVKFRRQIIHQLMHCQSLTYSWCLDFHNAWLKENAYKIVGECYLLYPFKRIAIRHVSPLKTQSFDNETTFPADSHNCASIKKTFRLGKSLLQHTAANISTKHFLW